VGLTNGIMRDSRVMHFPDPEFISKYNKQGQFGYTFEVLKLVVYMFSVGFEAQACKAWTEGGPDLVIRDALARQRKDGWDATRPALSLTIR
jgi:stress-induced-phosphoprotein 1